MAVPPCLYVIILLLVAAQYNFPLSLQVYFSSHGGVSDSQIYTFTGNTCSSFIPPYRLHTQIYSFQKLCLALTLSTEIQSIGPKSLSASFVLSQSIYISLFTLERLWRESLHVHCWFVAAQKHSFSKKSYNNDKGCQMNHSFSGDSFWVWAGTQPYTVRVGNLLTLSGRQMLLITDFPQYFFHCTTTFKPSQFKRLGPIFCSGCGEFIVSGRLTPSTHTSSC